MSERPPLPARNAKLEDLDPVFLEIIEKVEAQLSRRLAELDLDLVRSETRRTDARQIWLFASGRTRPGKKVTDCDGVETKSRHQKGLAVDYLIYRKDRVRGEGPIPDNHPAWDLIGAIGKAFGLRWGGDFKGRDGKPKPDKPHLEMPKRRQPAPEKDAEPSRADSEQKEKDHAENSG